MCPLGGATFQSITNRVVAKHSCSERSREEKTGLKGKYFFRFWTMGNSRFLAWKSKTAKHRPAQEVKNCWGFSWCYLLLGFSMVCLTTQQGGKPKGQCPLAHQEEVPQPWSCPIWASLLGGQDHLTALLLPSVSYLLLPLAAVTCFFSLIDGPSGGGLELWLSLLLSSSVVFPLPPLPSPQVENWRWGWLLIISARQGHKAHWLGSQD